MTNVVFSGREFVVSAVSSVVNDEESYEFASADRGVSPPLLVVVFYKDDDPTQTLYVRVHGEVELELLEQMISHAKKGFEKE
ncbi:hypothetical protein [Saccharothrix sp. Mg75]|uniref:hypothetical protein n=1 Tax=Saccharothrix sp. Mg75 TaxID=3445357 RepID=UPI003EECA7E6